MSLVDVINVGQGDCFILRPSNGCINHETTFIIDLGNGLYNITKNLTNDSKYHLILTHSHDDHIGGFKYLIGKDFNKIEKITVPLYQNEIALIASFLKNIKGIEKLNNIQEILKELNDIISQQKVLKKISDEGTSIFNFAYDGQCLCNHILFLNPILDSKSYCYDEKNITRISNCFSEKVKNQFRMYMSMGRLIYSDLPEINELIIKEDIEKIEDVEKRDFIKDFFINIIGKIEDFNNKPSKAKLRSIIKDYKLNSNQASIVCKVNFDKSILFTGDVDKKILKRIIKEYGELIKSDYLKIPHHGSKNNLNKYILKKINPKKAIISHNNAKFGNAKDTHPNQEVLDMLNDENVMLIVTNNILKNNKIIFNRATENKEDNYVRVVDC